MATDWRLLSVMFVGGFVLLVYGINTWGTVEGYLSAISGCGILIADFALAFLKS